jgi:CspA family cold shock protein
LKGGVRVKGVVKRWLSGRGYGFIQTDEYDKDIFVHYTGLKNTRDLVEGERVQFEIVQTEKGPKAINVEIIQSGSS